MCTGYSIFMRVVLDTNVLIDAYNDDFSPAAKLIDAVRHGELDAVYTRAVEREYHKILRRLIENEEHHAKISEFIAAAQLVEPERADEVALDDADDYKFVQAAKGGGADMIVSNDRHLLDASPVGTIKVVTPAECWIEFSDEESDGSAWKDWMKGLGL